MDKILWNIVFSRLNKIKLPANVKIITFVDYIAIIIADKNELIMERNIVGI